MNFFFFSFFVKFLQSCGGYPFLLLNKSSGDHLQRVNLIVSVYPHPWKGSAALQNPGLGQHTLTRSMIGLGKLL